jgi:hypothetical protein
MNKFVFAALFLGASGLVGGRVARVWVVALAGVQLQHV